MLDSNESHLSPPAFIHINCCKLASFRFSVKLQRTELKQELLRDFILEILIINDILTNLMLSIKNYFNDQDSRTKKCLSI